MPGRVWTPEQKEKLAETMRLKHSGKNPKKAEKKAPNKKAVAKTAAPKKPGPKPERKKPGPKPGQKRAKKQEIVDLAPIAAAANPWKLRDVREHVQELCHLAQIQGLDIDVSNAITTELIAGLEILKKERQMTYGLSSIEEQENVEAELVEKLAAAKTEPAPTPAEPVPTPAETAKPFTPANVGDFRGQPNGFAPPPAPAHTP